jgi:hypothetical protein
LRIGGAGQYGRGRQQDGSFDVHLLLLCWKTQITTAGDPPGFTEHLENHWNALEQFNVVFQHPAGNVRPTEVSLIYVNALEIFADHPS